MKFRSPVAVQPVKGWSWPRDIIWLIAMIWFIYTLVTDSFGFRSGVVFLALILFWREEFLLDRIRLLERKDQQRCRHHTQDN